MLGAQRTAPGQHGPKAVFRVLPVWGQTYAVGKNRVGSRTDGKIYEMSQSVATDIDGTGLRRVRRAPHLVNELNRITYDRFTLYMEVGLGLSTGQGSDPLAMLRWSNDGGQSFGNVLEASAGPVGEYKRRVIWRKLGQARDRVFEVRQSDPVKSVWLAAYLELSEGLN